MSYKIEPEIKYVCTTSVNINKNGKVTFGESTIVRPEKDLIVIKKIKRGRN